jgi:N-acetylmuramoyl-L-alanine amidase
MQRSLSTVAERGHPYVGRPACVLLTGAALIACSGSGNPAAAAGASARPATRQPLAGKTVGVDPGHNGRNYTDPTYIDHQIWNGREYEDCNTTGTETDGGYTEARFNWNVATYLVADLKAEGARIVLTRHSNDGVGPCVNRRAQIMNRAHVAVGIAIHADGGPPNGRGFAILEPVADGINNRSIHASYRFARILRTRFLAATHMPLSTYDGIDGLQPRDDLAGENLTKEPYALIECGNMRNATDARLLVTARFQRQAAAANAAALPRFLARR